jgi:hypothetical protein
MTNRPNSISLLRQGTSDALTVGQLEIDINNLRKQLQLPNSSYHASALAILTPDQTAKLADLVRALQLQQPAWVTDRQMTAIEEQVTSAFEEMRDDVYRYVLTLVLPPPQAQDVTQPLRLGTVIRLVGVEG